MTPDEFRQLTTDADYPLVVRTRADRKYILTSEHAFFISEHFPNSVIVTRPGKGVLTLAIDAIDSVQSEHQPTVA